LPYGRLPRIAAEHLDLLAADATANARDRPWLDDERCFLGSKSAAAYAWERLLDQSIITIYEMGYLHGTLNAADFAFCGFLGHALLPPRHAA
jgi:hypothetical protein